MGNPALKKIKPMKLKIEEAEFRTQKHEMWLEGTSDFEPTISDVQYLSTLKGYSVSGVEIWYDKMQYVWRYRADLKHLNPFVY